MTKRCYIYIRVSTREQAEEGYSIGEQQERLIKYAEAMGWTIVKVYIDPGQSGATMDRPGLQEMIAAINDVDIVLVDKLDRLSRSLYDTLYMIQKVFGEQDVSFVSRNEAFDTSTSFGRAMVGILAVFAELERERIKERMADGRNGRAKEGKWHGQPPTGYDYDKQSGVLQINAYEAIQIREAFDLAAQRVPLLEIVKGFHEKGYRTKTGTWRVESLRGILASRAYLGEVKHRGEWFDGLHTPLIDLELFDAVQVILAERSKENERYKPGKRYASPLGGLIWCKHCGAKYLWRSGKERSYYSCGSRAKCDPKLVKDPNCKNKIYRDFRLENMIYDEIRQLKSDPGYVEKLRTSVDTSEKQAVIEARIKALSSQISKLMDLYSLTDMPMEEVSAKVTPLAEEKKALTAELQTLQSSLPEVSVDRVRELAEVFDAILAVGDSHAIRAAVGELIDYLEIDGEKIHIHWNF